MRSTACPGGSPTSMKRRIAGWVTSAAYNARRAGRAGQAAGGLDREEHRQVRVGCGDRLGLQRQAAELRIGVRRRLVAAAVAASPACWSATAAFASASCALLDAAAALRSARCRWATAKPAATSATTTSTPSAPTAAARRRRAVRARCVASARNADSTAVRSSACCPAQSPAACRRAPRYRSAESRLRAAHVALASVRWRWMRSPSRTSSIQLRSRGQLRMSASWAISTVGWRVTGLTSKVNNRAAPEASTIAAGTRAIRHARPADGRSSAPSPGVMRRRNIRRVVAWSASPSSAWIASPRLVSAPANPPIAV